MATITVFVGSVREGRQGIHLARWVAKQVKARGHSVHFLDPCEHEWLLTLKQMYKSVDNPTEEMKTIRDMIVESDGYIAVTPEYNHSFSGALKNALDHFLEEYYFKPFCIVTYSAGGFGGIRAAETLRLVCAELGAPAVPRSLAVSKVQDVFDDAGNLKDDAYKKRLAGVLDEFEWYIDALKAQRAKGTPY